MHYDNLIIGAGLSGLAAGIRLAHFGKKTCIVESHSVPGGLNSYYRRSKRSFNVGLHAFTNYVPAGTRGTALAKLLRQLRLRHEDLGLVEQTFSRIAFPSCELRFSNEFELLRSQVEEKFPGEIDNFSRLDQRIQDFDETALEQEIFSAHGEVGKFISDPLLLNLLFCPILFYGSASENDMPFHTFALLWKALYRAGFAYPEGGMKAVLDLLTGKFTESGGELRLGARVERIDVRDGLAREAVLSSGDRITADRIFSSAGYVETMRLCGAGESNCAEVGKISVAEYIACLDCQSRDLKIEDTIIFFSCNDDFAYRRPDCLADFASGVIAMPDNYRHREPWPEGMVRVVSLANYDKWFELLNADNPRLAEPAHRRAYEEAKNNCAREMIAVAGKIVGDFSQHIVFSDLFTPLTLKRYTGHLQGTLYGSPGKKLNGATPFANLYIVGTDQGFLGIVGAMLSGISIANLHGLS
jgi:phytoene dehydrogenase-like protein